MKEPQKRKVLFTLVDRTVYLSVFVPESELKAFLEHVQRGYSFLLNVGHNRATINAYRGETVPHFYFCNVSDQLISGFKQRKCYYHLFTDQGYSTYLFSVEIPFGFFQHNTRFCPEHMPDEQNLKDGAVLLKTPEVIDISVLKEIFFSFMSATIDELAKGDDFGFPTLPHGIRRKLEEYGLMQIGALCNLKNNADAYNDPLIREYLEMIREALWKLGLDFDEEFYSYWIESCGITP